jgi:polysaccharide pyruvyl transferase WcaK-like protein
VRIGLINAYSTLNLGDAAIYSAFRSLLGGVDLVACVRDEAPDPRLGITFLPERPRDCDAYVSVGGDIFNNAREWFLTRDFLQNLAELNRRARRTILFGQSIPRSCHGLSFFALRQCLLRLAAVCVRDAESHRRLRQAGVAARLSYDVAFVLEGSEAAGRAADRLLADRSLEPDRTAVLSVRGFDSMYTHDNDRFVEAMALLCRGLQRQGRQAAVIIQSRAYGADSDPAVADAIVARAPGTVVLDPFLPDPDLISWQVALAIFERVERVIAVRYHTAVLSLAAGRVPYHLHYSNKGRDLCERLRLPGRSLAGLDPDLALAEILSLPSTRFDPVPIRQQVRADFRWCLDRLPGTEDR